MRVEIQIKTGLRKVVMLGGSYKAMRFASSCSIEQFALRYYTPPITIVHVKRDPVRILCYCYNRGVIL